MIRRFKRLLLGASLAATSMVLPLVSHPAAAICTNSPDRVSCGNCPGPIVIKGKVIVPIYC